MAEAKKTVEEKLYTIPLRAEFLKKTRFKKSKKSISVIRDYLLRHMKAPEVKISPSLNEHIWSGGAKKPMPKIKVKVATDDKGKVTVMLPEERLEIIEKKGLAEKIFRRKGETESTIVKGQEPPAVSEDTKKESNQKPKSAKDSVQEKAPQPGSKPMELTKEERELIADVEKELIEEENKGKKKK